MHNEKPRWITNGREQHTIAPGAYIYATNCLVYQAVYCRAPKRVVPGQLCRSFLPLSLVNFLCSVRCDSVRFR